METRRRAVRGGFTLVEILAVVAIMAVLALILLPALQGARRSANAAKGTSRLRSLALAELQYAADNDGFFTKEWVDDNSAVWQQRLGPYLGITAVGSPSTFWNMQRMDPRSPFNVPDSIPLAKRATGATSIGLNSWINYGAAGGGWKYRAIAVSSSSKIILLGENPVEANSDVVAPWDQGASTYSFHRGGRALQLFAFCDGHAEGMAGDLLADDVSKRRPGAPNLWRWWYQPGVGTPNWQ